MAAMNENDTAAMRRQAMLLDLRQKNKQRQDYVDQYGEDAYARAEAQRAASNKEWGSEAASGAAKGSQFGPWGTLAGGILGTASGQMDAYKQYKREGHSPLKAAGKALFDVEGTLKGLMGSGSQIGAIAQGVQGAKSRRPTEVESASEKFGSSATTGMKPEAQSGAQTENQEMNEETEWERRRRNRMASEY